MGALDEAFAGTDGLANALIDLLGGEALFETVLGEEDNEETDRTYKDIRRQRLPFVIESVSNSSEPGSVPNGESGGLMKNRHLYSGTVPAANLDTVPLPLKTVIRQGRERYQVVTVEPVYCGGTPVVYRIAMRRL